MAARLMISMPVTEPLDAGDPPPKPARAIVRYLATGPPEPWIDLVVAPHPGDRALA